MFPVAAVMDSEFCTYANCKVDSQVLRLVKAAASLADQTIQDWLSDVANREASKQLNRKPIIRRTSPPKKSDD